MKLNAGGEGVPCGALSMLLLLPLLLLPDGAAEMVVVVAVAVENPPPASFSREDRCLVWGALPPSTRRKGEEKCLPAAEVWCGVWLEGRLRGP